MRILYRLIAFFLSAVILVGCSKEPVPKHANNLCLLFLDRPHWLWAAEKAQHRWRVPMSELMAVMYQESHFRRGATPKRQKLFKIIPWFPSTTAEGYAQATNETWRVYVKNRHRLSADRDRFSDAVDFVAWYISYAHQKLRISKANPYTAYLAYHEGVNGYQQKSYWHKIWLKHVAKKVQKRAKKYHNQLMGCLHTLPKRPWWN